nr:phosphoribosylanthranilate isomerase [Lachnospiraceae bacterium]
MANKTKIKFCGLTRLEDIFTVNEVKPEYIGFVFAKRSKRYVTFEDALKLKSKLDPSIKAVGVFVNEDADKVISYLNEGVIDIAQLHGDEDDDYILRVKNSTNKE